MSLLDRWIDSRRVIKSLERLAVASERQVDLLQRLADRLAPVPPPDPSKLDLLHTGPSFGRDREFAEIEAAKDQLSRTLKRDPDEQELVDFLDGKEQSLDL